MRTIVISTDVFAVLWARRQPGEDSENAVLERLLGLPKGPPLPLLAAAAGQVRDGARNTYGHGGIYNRMFDVHFPPGFEIFRTYKGREYAAVVQDGRWVMNAQSFPSLFALSMAIIDSRENPWMHWKYRDAKGRAALIGALRKIPPELDETVPAVPDAPRLRSGKAAAKRPAKTTRRR
jgi:hypothetical protein